jgi:hypothetical protein
MDKSEVLFGKAAQQAETINMFLSLEQVHGRSERFTELDSILDTILIRTLSGKHIVQRIETKDTPDTISIPGLMPDERRYIDTTFAVEKQQSRGSWFFPDTVSIKAGIINLPNYYHENHSVDSTGIGDWGEYISKRQGYSRFAGTLVQEDRGRARLLGNPHAVLLWAILEPLFETLFLPFALRGWLAGTKTKDQQRELWETIDHLYAALNIDVDEAMKPFRYGGGWSRLRAAAQHEAKLRLLFALSQAAKPGIAARYRVFRLRPLLTAYYKKSKKSGVATRKHVLTRALEKTLAGFFGGDWLAFLEYLGEPPHPDEHIATALPTPKLYVGNSNQAAEVAQKTGVPIEEVQQMLASFWQQDRVLSPIEQRVAVLRDYWAAFDAIHAEQIPGRKPLWGLLEERGTVNYTYYSNSTPYQSSIYRQLLPAHVIKDVDRLWATTVDARWPERMVREPFPHAAMAEAFGPVLRFWHGVALTAWFICEGPSSRTDIQGLPEYYRREIAALNDLGTPIDLKLFRDLQKAEGKLGAPERIPTRSSTSNVGYGISITASVYTESRRNGFEILRDIITTHRRAWAKTYLDAYITSRWETDLLSAAKAYHQAFNDRNRAPTLKQFARMATESANHWFAGDISGVYRSIGEKSPIEPTTNLMLPPNTADFVASVFLALGGQVPRPRNDYPGRTATTAQNDQLNSLAESSLEYLKVFEATGAPPPLKTFGVWRIEQAASTLGGDVDQRWEWYKSVIDSVLRSYRDDRERKTFIAPQEPLSLQPPSGVRNSGQVGQSQSFAPQPMTASTPANSKDDQPVDAQETPKKRSWLDRLLGRNKT